jgi:osmotically-inducible protein OsmY
MAWRRRLAGERRVLPALRAGLALLPALREGLALLPALSLLAFSLSGCGPPRQDRTAPGGPRRAAAPAAKEVEVQEDPVKTGIEAGDAGLAGRVRSRLAGDPRLRWLPIEVDAEAGRVTLWGHVGNAEERAAAEQLARGTRGVTSVVDLIKVGARAGPPR